VEPADTHAPDPADALASWAVLAGLGSATGLVAFLIDDRGQWLADLNFGGVQTSAYPPWRSYGEHLAECLPGSCSAIDGLGSFPLFAVPAAVVAAAVVVTRSRALMASLSVAGVGVLVSGLGMLSETRAFDRKGCEDCLVLLLLHWLTVLVFSVVALVVFTVRRFGSKREAAC
jgi:hypothetical protein